MSHTRSTRFPSDTTTKITNAERSKHLGVRFLDETDGRHLKAIVAACRQAQARDLNCIFNIIYWIVCRRRSISSDPAGPISLWRQSLRLAVRWRRKRNDRTSRAKAPKGETTPDSECRTTESSKRDTHYFVRPHSKGTKAGLHLGQLASLSQSHSQVYYSVITQ